MQFGRVLDRVFALLDSLPSLDVAAAEAAIHSKYHRPLSAAERASRYRDAKRHESVTPAVTTPLREPSHERDAEPSRRRDGNVTNAVTLDSVVGLGIASSNGSKKHIDALELLEFLNLKTGRSYRAVRTNLDMIENRLKSGASVADCRGIIARKVRQWQGTEFEKYLRPATLFNATKFEQYLGEKGTSS